MSTLNEYSTPNRMKIRTQISCPHCWHEFSTDQILFISESPELLGDVKLGDIAPVRFLPFRFDVSGAALDSHGIACHKLACPNCHLQIPRAILQMPNSFISIVGAPASGKSYFLASMIWKLRKTMTRNFCMNFTDADTAMNKRIRDYESTQFMNTGENKIVAIEKTEAQGDIYNRTKINGQETTLAQPFTFTITAMPDHPFQKQAYRSQMICLYDNAGESFLPGSDNITQPVTRHLVKSDVIMFLFDPTQDQRFQKACKKTVADPQMNSSLGGTVRRSEVRQETVLTEMIERIRAHARLSFHEKHKRPLIIVLTKLDAWKQLATFFDYKRLWYRLPDKSICVFDVKKIEEYSQQLRQLLLDLIPDLVSTAESFAENVTYMAVSATGGPPTVDPKTNATGYIPSTINPVWVETPFLYAQTITKKYCVPIYNP
ncbi:MAG: hypothetical protein LBP59_06320 [Planctomycetaceae bacterium]|jgi:hypothetical protein|nr:hypothetical protein [Planctomycetaceae bacterium]